MSKKIEEIRELYKAARSERIERDAKILCNEIIEAVERHAGNGNNQYGRSLTDRETVERFGYDMPATVALLCEKLHDEGFNTAITYDDSDPDKMTAIYVSGWAEDVKA